MTKIRVNCLSCEKELWRSPSKVEPRNYCSYKCYAKVRDKEILERGKPFRITKQSRKNVYDGHSVPKGSEHRAWKGEKVGYRGLHYWLRRNLGKPTKCLHCGKVDTRPRFIQWANKDGKYSRVLTDYIPLCASCHKIYDLANQATQG